MSPSFVQQPLTLTGRFLDAVAYITHLHTETRKGTEIPYVAHLMGVASMVMGENGYLSFAVTEDMVIAALLHDVVEDHGGAPRLEEVRQKFGDNVARMVADLSDSLAESPEEKSEWKQRKLDYLAHLKKSTDHGTQLISAADKLYNAKAILEDYRLHGPQLWKRFKRGASEQLWYFEELCNAYDKQSPNRIVNELKKTVRELRQLCELELTPNAHRC